MICRVLVRREGGAEARRTSRSWRLRRVGLLLRERSPEVPAAVAGLQLHVLDLGGDLQDLLLGGRGADVEVHECLAGVAAKLLGACAELLDGLVIGGVR